MNPLYNHVACTHLHRKAPQARASTPSRDGAIALGSWRLPACAAAPYRANFGIWYFCIWYLVCWHLVKPKRKQHLVFGIWYLAFGNTHTHTHTQAIRST
jgi:hypothetical protein